MPHAVLEGQVDLAAYTRNFRPLLLRRGADVLRADQLFVDREGRTLLIEALVIEAGRKQPFYIKISGHERGSATIRVDPMTHPERSAGVRELVARIAADVLRVSPDAEIGATNLVLPSPDQTGEEP